MNLHFKRNIPDSQQYPRNFDLIHDVEENVVFSKASEANNGQVTFAEKSQMKITILQNKNMDI